jgi:hypothetical protein
MLERPYLGGFLKKSQTVKQNSGLRLLLSKGNNNSKAIIEAKLGHHLIATGTYDESHFEEICHRMATSGHDHGVSYHWSGEEQAIHIIRGSRVSRST